MDSVGVDACLFQREGAASSFHAPMGVAVSIRDREEFRRKYDDVLDDLFMKHGEDGILTVPILRAIQFLSPGIRTACARWILTFSIIFIYPYYGRNTRPL